MTAMDGGNADPAGRRRSACPLSGNRDSPYSTPNLNRATWQTVAHKEKPQQVALLGFRIEA
tara:strand:+ start:452 stop:634 length:183 start_codon:yes stop_codon:yes gene_type:complete